MDYTLSYKDMKENMAHAIGKHIGISYKYSSEICKYIRNRKVETAKKMLQEVIDIKKAVPIKRFNRDCGHKRGTGPGKYPVTAAKAILLVLNNAESNAKSKGLSGNLVIEHIIAQKAPGPWHYGRKRRRKMKRAHIEIVVAEEKKDAK